MRSLERELIEAANTLIGPIDHAILMKEAAGEIRRLRDAIRPFAEWDENDSSTHGFLSDPAAWAKAKSIYFNK